MTRVLYWNVQTFGFNKFFNTEARRRRDRGHGGLSPQAAAVARRALLIQVLVQTQPDILVIIEPGSGDSTPNQLATQTGGMNGLVALLAHMNALPALNPLLPGGGDVWALVPPLRVGTGGISETVGVFFRRVTGAVTRYFTGPNIWTGGYNGLSADPAAPAAPASAPYPSPPPGGAINVNAMLVPAGTAPRDIPRAALHNGVFAPAPAMRENEVAARVAFVANAAPPAPPGPGLPIAFGALRPPYMATFTETTAGVVTRNLTLFAIHSPPAPPASTNYMATLGTVFDIVSPLGALETRVVGGDFNLNLLTAAGNNANAYNPLTVAPNAYTTLLAPAGAAPANVDAYIGYFSTHIRGKTTTAASKFLWSQDAGHQSFYPGYGYVGSNFVAAPFYSIDNILVWPHQAPPYDYQTTVMNLVTGSPFNAVAPPLPGAPPVGTVAMADAMFVPAVAWWPEAPAAADYPGIGEARRLTGWNHYGRIVNTSDHFAVYATI